jgi:hypothetical protein
MSHCAKATVPPLNHQGSICDYACPSRETVIGLAGKSPPVSPDVAGVFKVWQNGAQKIDPTPWLAARGITL